MKILFTLQKGERKAEIKGDGGAYYLHLYENSNEKIVPFMEHTLKIVENKAKEWIENECKTN